MCRQVLLARQVHTEELFAVKVIRKEAIVRKNIAKHVEVFILCHVRIDLSQAESDILAKMQNPYVVRLFMSFQTPVFNVRDCFSIDSKQTSYYLIMEYLPGGDVFSLLQVQVCD